MDSLYILVMFWGSKKHPGIQGIHVGSLLVPWIPHGIHEECVGEGKELARYHICMRSIAHISFHSHKSPHSTKHKRKRANEETEINEEAGINEEWDAVMKKRAKKPKTIQASTSKDDDSLFKYSGMVGDNETNNPEAQAVAAEKKPIVKAASGAYVEFFTLSRVGLLMASRQWSRLRQTFNQLLKH